MASELEQSSAIDGSNLTTSDDVFLTVDFASLSSEAINGVRTFTAAIDGGKPFSRGLTTVRVLNMPENLNFIGANANEVVPGTTKLFVGKAKLQTLGVNYSPNSKFAHVYVNNTYKRAIHGVLQMMVVA